MAEFGCIRRPDETATPDLAGLTYLTEDVRTIDSRDSSVFQDSQR